MRLDTRLYPMHVRTLQRAGIMVLEWCISIMRIPGKLHERWKKLEDEVETRSWNLSSFNAMTLDLCLFSSPSFYLV